MSKSLLFEKNSFRKKLVIWLLLVGMMGGFFISCDKNAFDFSRFEGTDVAGDWGIKLADATFSIGDIVGRLENNSFLDMGDDDILNLVYNAEFYEIIKSSDYMSFAPVHQTGNYSLDLLSVKRLRENLTTNYTVPISLDNPYVSVIQGIVKSGALNITINHNLPEGGDVVISSEHIFNSDGTPFSQSIHLSADVVRVNLNLAGCVLHPTNNTVNIKADINFPRPDNDLTEVVLDYDYCLTDLELQEADLLQINPVEIPYNKNFNIHIQNGNFSGDFVVFDPNIRVLVKNSFDQEATCRLEHAQFSGQNLPTVDLVPTVVDLQIPNSPYAYQESEMSNIPSIHFYADYSSLNVSGKMIIEPSGEPIHLDQNSTISLKVLTEIPLRVDLNDIAYRDTIQMNAIALPGMDMVENLTFRVLFENDLPIDMDMQIYFCDDEYQILDSLFTNPYILQGAYGGVPVPCEPIYVQKSNFAEIQKLINSSHMIIYAKLNTQGKVDIDVSRFLHTQIAAKWNMVL